MARASGSRSSEEPVRKRPFARTRVGEKLGLSPGMVAAHSLSLFLFLFFFSVLLFFSFFSLCFSLSRFVLSLSLLSFFFFLSPPHSLLFSLLGSGAKGPA